MLATKNVRNLSPDWHEGSVSKEISATYPNVADRSVKMTDNGGDGGSDDGSIESGKEEGHGESSHDYCRLELGPARFGEVDWVCRLFISGLLYTCLTALRNCRRGEYLLSAILY